MTRSIHDRLARSADAFATGMAFEAALAVVANDAGVDPHDRAVRSPGRHATRAAPDCPSVFREAVYLTVVCFNRRQRAVARAVGVKVQAVNQAVIEVERKRGNVAYDRRLDELELGLMGGVA